MEQEEGKRSFTVGLLEKLTKTKLKLTVTKSEVSMGELAPSRWRARSEANQNALSRSNVGGFVGR